MKETPEESAQIKRWLVKQADRRAANMLPAAIAFHLFSLALGFLLYRGAWATILPGVNVFLLIFNTVSVLINKRGHTSWPRSALYIGDMLTVYAFSFANYMNRRSGSDDVATMIGDYGLVAMTTFIVMTSTHSGLKVYVTAFVYALAIIPSLTVASGDLYNDFGLYLFIITCTAGSALRASTDRLERAHALAQQRLMAKLAPRQIVRRAMESGEDTSIDTIFAPEDRFCICICSDWRSYQALTQSMPARDVVQALESYYEVAEALLAQAFPDGNYFSDWIADELFVVAFTGTERRDQENLARQATAFSRALLVAKAARAAEGLPPRGIDLGVAAGIASVGIIGPRHHRKATALGEIPGRSRRLQTAAKSLRDKLGVRDRAILGAEVVALLGPDHELTRFTFEDEAQVKDLADRDIFFLVA